MIFRPGVQTTTTFPVIARSDTDGATLTMTVTGFASLSGQVSDYATDDGVVLFEQTGLSPNTLYEYTISSSASEDDVTGTIRTMPETGEVKIVVISCVGNADLHIARAIAREQPHIVVITGDLSYKEGQYIPTLAAALDVESHYALKREGIGRPGIGESDHHLQTWLWSQGVGCAYVVDDHDWGLNDPVDDMEAAKADYIRARGAGQGFEDMTLTDWNNIKANAAQAISAYSKGNPVNSDPEAETDAYYFRFEAGDCEVFVLSQVVSSPTRMRPPKGDVSLNGAAQEAWLKAQLTASAKPFKLIATPKNALQNRQANPDNWEGYNDVYALLKWISDNATGTFLIGGDFHSAGMFAAKKGIPPGAKYSSQGLRDASGLSYDFDCLSFCASSCGRYAPSYRSEYGNTRCDVRESDKNGEGPVDTALFVCTQENGRVTTGINTRQYICFGLAHILGNGYSTISLVNQVSDVICSANIKAGTNTIYEGEIPDAVIKGYIGLHYEDSRIVSALSYANINTGTARSWSKTLAEAYVADAGDYIDQLGANLEILVALEKTMNLGIYKTSGAASSLPVGLPEYSRSKVVPGNTPAGVQTIDGLYLPLDDGAPYSICVAEIGGASIRYASAATDIPGSSSSCNGYAGSTPDFPAWSDDGTFTRTYVAWARVMGYE